MMIKCKVSNILLYVSLLAFILFAVYILHINQEVLYTAHDRSEFIYGTPYLYTLLSKPFGLIQYVGAWLTQFFYHPMTGAAILMGIWLLIFWVGTKAFRLQGSASAWMLLPVAFLLTATVDLGYWIYIFSIRGYWFSQSVGYLVMLLLLWAARSTPRKWHLAWYLLGVCIYPVLGWFALLFIVCLALSEKPSWRELLALVLLIFTAGIWHTQVYSNLKFDDVILAGLPHFETPLDSSDHLSIPFWLLAAVSILLPLGGRYLAKWFTPIICAISGIIFTCSLMYRDQNYLDEMRMVRYAADDNWQEVLHIAEGKNTPTITMVMLKNLALMNEGDLLDRSFKLGNDGIDINNPDSLHVSLFNIASPLIYYNYGRMNDAVRLDVENAIFTGFSPFYLKMLSRCAYAIGDEKLLERYTTLLRHHLFYGNWQPPLVTEKVSELQQSFVDEINGVESNCVHTIIDGFSALSDTDSKVASEQALFYAMIRCDSRRFWLSLRNYVKLHMDENFPLHAQEAYIMYMDKAPEEKRIMLPVEQTVYDRYKKFWEILGRKVKPGVQLDKIGEEMRKEWQDTYWYYNIFGRKQ